MSTTGAPPPLPSTAHRAVLRRVGVVLMAIGIADIGLFIYCIVTEQAYASGLNVLAIAAGALVYQGKLDAVRVVTAMLAFLLGAFPAVLAAVLLITPPELAFLNLRLDPLAFLLTAGFGATLLLALLWALLQLRSAPVLAARAAAGQKTGRPWLGLALGLVVSALGSSLVVAMLTSDAAARARQVAKQQYGPDYLYTVRSIRMGDGHVSASLAAYNDDEIRTVEVSWDE